MGSSNVLATVAAMNLRTSSSRVAGATRPSHGTGNVMESDW
jgi:hypothetical protein